MWPPSGRCSRNASTPNTPAANAIAGNTSTTAQSSGWAPPRSRHSAGSTATVTAAYAAASSTNGTPFSTTAWVASVTGLPDRGRMVFRGTVRALLVKMGLSAYFAAGRRCGSVIATGRCEPRRVFLA